MLEMMVSVGLGLSYIVDTLLLRQRETHEGPFPVESKCVVFTGKIGEDSGKPHFQRFALFDRIRNLFGIYDVEQMGDEQLFYVKEDSWKTEIFTCPKCLSMWAAFAFSIPYFLSTRNLWKTIIFHFGISGVSVLGNFTVGFLQASPPSFEILTQAESSEDYR